MYEAWHIECLLTDKFDRYVVANILFKMCGSITGQYWSLWSYHSPAEAVRCV